MPVLPVGVTIADISQILTGFGRNLGAPGGNATQWVVPNLAGISSLFNINCNRDTGVAGGDFTLTGITNGNARGGNRFISEESRGYYLQADFKTDIFDMPLRGDIGFRQVETLLYAEGYSSTGGGTKVYGSHRYDSVQCRPRRLVEVQRPDQPDLRRAEPDRRVQPSVGRQRRPPEHLGLPPHRSPV